MDNSKKEIKSSDSEFINNKEIVAKGNSENSIQPSKLNPDIEVLSITPIEEIKIEEKISDSNLKEKSNLIRDEYSTHSTHSTHLTDSTNTTDSTYSGDISKLNPNLEELIISSQDTKKIEKEVFIKAKNKNQPL